MARFLLAALALVGVLVLGDCRILEKDAMAAKITAARNLNKNVNQLRGVAALKSTFDLRQKGGAGKAHDLANGEQVLGGVLNNAGKRSLNAFNKGRETSSKKSYQEVFMVADFIKMVVDGMMHAPCMVGVMAFDRIMHEHDWEHIDMTEEHVDTQALAVIEWWTENKCTEFFTAADAFVHFIWSIFWDDLEDTPCGQALPHDPDFTVNWKAAFNNINSMNPEEWENVPEPETECQAFELIGEVFMDFFFAEYYDTMPDDLLEDMFNDYGVNDRIDPYFGYAFMHDDSSSSSSASDSDSDSYSDHGNHGHGHGHGNNQTGEGQGANQHPTRKTNLIKTLLKLKASH